MTNLIFIGPPGAGKGSVSKRFLEKGYAHLSTGDLLREEIKKGTVLGEKINALISQGNFVSDEMALELITHNLPKTSFILDGFPRTFNQAKMLDAVLSTYTVVFFEINEEKLVDRLVHRETCSNCGSVFNVKLNPAKSVGLCDHCGNALTQRKDDTEEVIKNRLKVYNDSTAKLKSFYKNWITLNADQSLDRVVFDLEKALDESIRT